MPKSFGLLALVVYLLLVGILSITNITFQLQHFVVGITAILAAVLLWLGK